MREVEIIEEIKQVKMRPEIEGAPAYWVSVYLVDGLLIDTGAKTTVEDLRGFLDRHDVKLAVNTHHHEDHVGGNKLVKEKFGVDVFAHPDAIPRIAAPPELSWYRDFYWGRPEPSDVLPLGDMVETRRFLFDVIETPGHCGDHVVLVERKRGWCFSGDLYLGRRIQTAAKWWDLTELVKSMRTLMDLPVERLVLFTSMRTVEPEGKRALAAAVKYFEQLSRKAKELEKNGVGFTQIRDEILGGPSPMDRITGGIHSTENLIMAALRAEI